MVSGQNARVAFKTSCCVIAIQIATANNAARWLSGYGAESRTKRPVDKKAGGREGKFVLRPF